MTWVIFREGQRAWGRSRPRNVEIARSYRLPERCAYFGFEALVPFTLKLSNPASTQLSLQIRHSLVTFSLLSSSILNLHLNNSIFDFPALRPTAATTAHLRNSRLGKQTIIKFSNMDRPNALIAVTLVVVITVVVIAAYYAKKYMHVFARAMLGSRHGQDSAA